MEILGRPMLSRVVERTRRAKLLDEIVVATTQRPADNSIVQLCQANAWPYFQGSEDDVLDRYYRAAKLHHADVVVRVTSDCPLIDPELIDKAIQIFRDGRQELDYVSNKLPPTTFPIGLDVEVVRFTALARAWKEDNNPKWREHVTPYLYHHPEKFRLRGFSSDVDYSRMRWTVDAPEDLEFVRRIYGYFGHDQFHWHDVLVALEAHLEWSDVNRHVRQKPVPT
jgi:spore coat polysaccharide biosynthesis protein SpsF